MDLALEFGATVEQLSSQMTEREFGWWLQRARTHWLPTRRMEWYLARIAQMIALSAGAKECPLSDFMLELEPVDTEPASIEDVHEFFGFSPRGRKAA